MDVWVVVFLLGLGPGKPPYEVLLGSQAYATRALCEAHLQRLRATVSMNADPGAPPVCRLLAVRAAS